MWLTCWLVNCLIFAIQVLIGNCMRSHTEKLVIVRTNYVYTIECMKCRHDLLVWCTHFIHHFVFQITYLSGRWLIRWLPITLLSIYIYRNKVYCQKTSQISGQLKMQHSIIYWRICIVAVFCGKVIVVANPWSVYSWNLTRTFEIL